MYRVFCVSLVKIMFGVVLLLLCLSSATASLSFKNGSNEIIHCIEKERQALLAFRAGLTVTDDFFRLPSWSTKDCCKWRGVECSTRTGHVIKLDLGLSAYLKGEISPSLLELRELNYLDLRYISFENRPIPKFFGSFTKLKHLDLSYCDFAGTIPQQLGNLSNLNYLDLSPSHYSDYGKMINLSVENIDWLSRLSSLETLYMDNIDLSRATNWLDAIKSLPFLSSLSFRNCQLSKVRSHSSSSSVNSSSNSIKTLDLSSNGLTSSIYSGLFNLSSSLVYLTLSDNLLKGPISEAFGDYMPFLKYLDLSSNTIEGMIPNSFGNLCNLIRLDMRNNSLSGNLSDFVDILYGSGCASAPPLQSLSVDNNKLYGPLPDGIIRFSSLRELTLSSNQLNGTLTKNMGTLSQLEYLYLSSNALTGIVSEAHFSSLSRLTVLDFSFNPLQIKVSPQWFPHFQLDFLGLMSCNLGPRFPNWIQTQKSLFVLDISNNGISDKIPSWFWDLPTLYSNLSLNKFGGTLPDLSSKQFRGKPGFDLSSNNFEGPIPMFPSTLASINLSKNKFSGNLSFLCKLSDLALSFLDISHNLLTGEIPDCLGKLKELVVVNLAHNRHSGEIPSSLGSLSSLETLNLYNNTFSGELPLSLSNCEQLSFLDVGENMLTGNVPAWIGGNISQISILSLRSNNFFGTIPLNLCQLNKLQVLDLSMNNLDGSIPSCLNNLSAMVQKGLELNSHQYASTYDSRSSTESSSISLSYADYSVIGWEGRELEFGNNLRLLKLIDLSSNNLSGEIPDEITKLFELVALNLSRNALRGNVPQHIGELKSILSLDLSRNRFSGKIPASLSQLNSLSYLDMSHNKFSGKIPSGTQLQSFDASKFIGNVGLCGPPLTSKCPGDESRPNVIGNEESRGDDENEFTKWQYMGQATGFVTGFWGICGAFLLNRRGRHAFFLFVDELTGWFYVKMAARNYEGLYKCEK